MNKFMKVLAASALVATALTGCGSKAKYAKAGLGVVSSVGSHSSETECNTTFAAIGLDSDGKIQYIDIDVAQGDPNKNELMETKKERKENYNMKNSSGIQKEWYEQIAAFEQQCMGKTPDEVTKFAVDGEGKPTDADVKAGCTMAITDFQAAVKAAAANAKEVETDSLKLGRTMSYGSANHQKPYNQMNTDLVLVATDADGKIQWVDIETAQIQNDGSIVKTKTERQNDYGMKNTSAGIGKISGGAEWFEQVAHLESKLVGKTLDEAAKLAVDGEGKPTDADINSGCTISISAFETALTKAK